MIWNSNFSAHQWDFTRTCPTCGCSHATVAGLRSCDNTPHGTQSLKHGLSGFYIKRWLTPVPCHWSWRWLVTQQQLTVQHQLLLLSISLWRKNRCKLTRYMMRLGEEKTKTHHGHCTNTRFPGVSKRQRKYRFPQAHRRANGQSVSVVTTMANLVPGEHHPTR